MNEDRKSVKKDIAVILVGIIAFIYLVNPGFGLFELIPDTFPLIGNLDEASATFLILSALSYFGVDVRKILSIFRKS